MIRRTRRIDFEGTINGINYEMEPFTYVKVEKRINII